MDEAKLAAHRAGQALGKEHARLADGQVMGYPDPDVREQYLRGYRRAGRMAYEAPVHEPTPPDWKGGGHYSLNWLRPEHAWEWLRSKFQHGPSPMCWVLFSTSGVHGTYGTIDDLEETRMKRLIEGNEDPPEVTFLCVEPRLVRNTYGNVKVETERGGEWLRGLAVASLARIKESQEGNL